MGAKELYVGVFDDSELTCYGKNNLLMGAWQPVGVLDDPLFSDLDQELVAAEGAHVLLQLAVRNPLLGVVL